MAESSQHLAELRESTGAWLNDLLAADATADEWLAYVEANVPGQLLQGRAPSAAVKEETAPRQDLWELVAGEVWMLVS